MTTRTEKLLELIAQAIHDIRGDIRDELIRQADERRAEQAKKDRWLKPTQHKETK